MSDRVDATELSPEDAVYHYAVVCIAALGLVLLLLLHRGLGSWSVLPIVVGLAGVLLRWRLTPIATLLLVAGDLFAHETLQQEGPYRLAEAPSPRFVLSDWLLSGAVLAYVAAHYRLHGLTRSPFPSDRRRDHPAERPATGVPQRVSRTASTWEVGGLVLSLPVCAFLAQLAWVAVPSHPEGEVLSSPAWKAVLLVWILLVGLLAASSVLGYLHHRGLSATEARLFLQDTFWQQTRREQRRLNRWLAWARLRRRRKEA